MAERRKGSSSQSSAGGIMTWSTWAQKYASKLSASAGDSTPSSQSKGYFEKKIPVDDLPIYGFCPARSQLSLVICEQCGRSITPQGLLRHYEHRHSGAQLPESFATTTATTSASSTKRRRHISEHSTSKRSPTAKKKKKKRPTSRRVLSDDNDDKLSSSDSDNRNLSASSSSSSDADSDIEMSVSRVRCTCARTSFVLPVERWSGKRKRHDTATSGSSSKKSSRQTWVDGTADEAVARVRVAANVPINDSGGGGAKADVSALRAPKSVASSKSIASSPAKSSISSSPAAKRSSEKPSIMPSSGKTSVLPSPTLSSRTVAPSLAVAAEISKSRNHKRADTSPIKSSAVAARSTTSPVKSALPLVPPLKGAGSSLLGPLIKGSSSIAAPPVVAPVKGGASKVVAASKGSVKDVSVGLTKVSSSATAGPVKRSSSSAAVAAASKGSRDTSSNSTVAATKGNSFIAASGKGSNNASTVTTVKGSKCRPSARSSSVTTVASLSPGSPVLSTVNSVVSKSPTPSEDLVVPVKLNKRSSKQKEKLCRDPNSLPCKDREFDADRHCGVWLDDDDRQCTHSLTCKIHSLSLRRAVSGRSRPFDQLLADHRTTKEESQRRRLATRTPSTAASTPCHDSHLPPSVDSRPSPSPSPFSPRSSIAATPREESIPDEQTEDELEPEPEETEMCPSPVREPSPLPPPPTPPPPSWKSAWKARCTLLRSAKLFSLLAPSRLAPTDNSTLKKPVVLPVFPSSKTAGIPVTDDVATASSDDDDDEAALIAARLANKLNSSTGYINRHPRPLAVNGFSCWRVGNGCNVFNRQEVLSRSAFGAAVERSVPPFYDKKSSCQQCTKQEIPEISSTVPRVKTFPFAVVPAEPPRLCNPTSTTATSTCSSFSAAFSPPPRRTVHESPQKSSPQTATVSIPHFLTGLSATPDRRMLVDNGSAAFEESTAWRSTFNPISQSPRTSNSVPSRTVESSNQIDQRRRSVAVSPPPDLGPPLLRPKVSRRQSSSFSDRSPSVTSSSMDGPESPKSLSFGRISAEARNSWGKSGLESGGIESSPVEMNGRVSKSPSWIATEHFRTVASSSQGDSRLQDSRGNAAKIDRVCSDRISDHSIRSFDFGQSPVRPTSMGIWRSDVSTSETVSHQHRTDLSTSYDGRMSSSADRIRLSADRRSVDSDAGTNFRSGAFKEPNQHEPQQRSTKSALNPSDDHQNSSFADQSLSTSKSFKNNFREAVVAPTATRQMSDGGWIGSDRSSSNERMEFCRSDNVQRFNSSENVAAYSGLNSLVSSSADHKSTIGSTQRSTTTGSKPPATSLTNGLVKQQQQQQQQQRDLQQPYNSLMAPWVDVNRDVTSRNPGRTSYELFDGGKDHHRHASLNPTSTMSIMKSNADGRYDRGLDADISKLATFKRTFTSTLGPNESLTAAPSSTQYKRHRTSSTHRDSVS